MDDQKVTGSFRQMIRNLRLLDDHKAEVERVANELGSRGLLDLADDLRLSLKTLRTIKR